MGKGSTTLEIKNFVFKITDEKIKIKVSLRREKYPII